MPHHPEDDWTRPIPRSPRPDRRSRDGGPRDEWGRDEWGRDDGYGAQGRGDWRDARDDRTQYIPRQEQTQRISRREQERLSAGYGDDGYGNGNRYRDEDYERGYRGEGLDRGRDPRPGPGRGRDGAGGPPPPRAPRRRRRRYGLRRFLALLLLAVLAYVLAMVFVVSRVWGSIDEVDSTPDVADRPGGGSGETYLLVGTDSRDELTDEQRGEFGTGTFEGSRADTVMMLHVPTMGEPTLVSLPRDSYVEIRDHGFAKLNAAHSLGGPELLVDTVEQSTGMRISGYLEIGFGGFVGVVEKAGGVNMCLKEPIKDEKAHIDLPAGCQDLTGPQALGYVRMRYSDPRGDIGRVERQRQFLSALVKKMASPATVLNPWKLHQVGTATGGALARGEDTSMFETARMGLAMRSIANGKGNSVTVPVADTNYQTNVGSAVLWDEQGAASLFQALRDGDPITVQP